MLADRVRMGVVRDSFDGVLYKDGVGGDLWTVAVNPSAYRDSEIVQTTPFLEIKPGDGTHASSASPIATKEKYDLSKFNTIKIKYEFVLSSGTTDGIKEDVIDISSLSNTYPGDMYILIAIGSATREVRMFITPSYTQNQLTDGLISFVTAIEEYGWNCRIHEFILE